MSWKAKVPRERKGEDYTVTSYNTTHMWVTVQCYDYFTMKVLIQVGYYSFLLVRMPFKHMIPCGPRHFINYRLSSNIGWQLECKVEASIADQVHLTTH